MTAPLAYAVQEEAKHTPGRLRATRWFDPDNPEAEIWGPVIGGKYVRSGFPTKREAMAYGRKILAAIAKVQP